MHLLRLLSRLTAALPVAFAAAAPSAHPDRPNFVLCMTDDQGWGDVGYQGHPVLRTPHLDAMAAAGVRFDRFYAAHPVCSPTRGSVLSGRTPGRYRSYSWGFDLPLREVTVAEWVKTRGYATGHFGKWHLGGLPNADGITGRGVPEAFDPAPRDPGHQGFDEWFSAGNWFDRDPAAGTFWRNGEPVGALSGDTSDLVMAEALRFIGAKAAAGQPFLCVIWFPSPHGPWNALPGDREPYAGQADPDFLGEMAAVDRAMGRLRSELGRLGVRENTLVWFNSDNGAAGGSAGPLTGGKGSLWEGGIRVPGLIEWPARVRQPLRTRVPAGTVDILPTICDVLGLPLPTATGPLDGVSLLPVLEGRATTRPTPLGFEQRRPADGTLTNAALVDGDWKLLRVRGQLRRGKGESATGEPLKAGDYLFHLEEDVAEERDVSAAHPEVYARLRAQLEAFSRSVEESASAYPLAPMPERLNPRLLQRAAKAVQPLVDRLAFPAPGWAAVGGGTRQHREGALHLEGPAGARTGIHRTIALRHQYLQFAVRLEEGGRFAVELGRQGDPVARLTFDATGLAVTALANGTAAAETLRRPLPLAPGGWHNLLLEFADNTIGVHVGSREFAAIPVAAWPERRHEGFALLRESGAVAIKDVWMTAGELPDTAEAGLAGARGKGARAKAKRN
ncbi:MAG: sulfatase-like hydrolase/transferase [Verrucomicrobia bacterium]|nr:sulfatase-like hydrolase/transferase [Verrucomicrobiota bacterium]